MDGPDPQQRDRLSEIARLFGALIPDAVTTSIALLIIVGCAALWLGNPPLTVAEAYYRGLWMLLSFTMQMTLILVLSSALGSAPFFRRVIVRLSRTPKSETAVVASCIACGATTSYLYWGLGYALNPLVAVHFAREAERKGLRVDFPFLVSLTMASGSVWQYGFSASAPLLMNTPGHFLEDVTGIMPLSNHAFRSRHARLRRRLPRPHLYRGPDTVAQEAPLRLGVPRGLRPRRRRAAGLRAGALRRAARPYLL